MVLLILMQDMKKSREMPEGTITRTHVMNSLVRCSRNCLRGFNFSLKTFLLCQFALFLHCGRNVIYMVGQKIFWFCGFHYRRWFQMTQLMNFEIGCSISKSNENCFAIGTQRHISQWRTIQRDQFKMLTHKMIACERTQVHFMKCQARARKVHQFLYMRAVGN